MALLGWYKLIEEALANPYVLKSGGGPSNYPLTSQPDLRACAGQSR